MTREEFQTLPPAVALGLLYDVAHTRLVTMPVPSSRASTAGATPPAPAPAATPKAMGDARPPQYDRQLGRKGGFQWMSEMLVADLTWWLAKKRESVEAGGQYAARDARTVQDLERFIAWRLVAPLERWQGTRGDERVKAAVPSRDPQLYAWPSRGPAKLAPPPPAGGYGDANYGAGADDEIPF